MPVIMQRRPIRPGTPVAPLSALCVSLGLTLAAASANAAVEVADDIIVTGSACVGVDCESPGETFADAELRLQENNTRAAFVNSATTGSIGKRWYLVANDTANGGNNHFSIAVDTYGNHALHLRPGASGGAALGRYSSYSATESGQISVGSDSLQRRVIHVATPEEASDVLTVGAMQDFSLLQERRAQLDQLQALLALLRERVTALETGDADGDGTPNIDDDHPLADTHRRRGGVAVDVVPATESSTCSVASLAPSPTTEENRPLPYVSSREIDFTLTGCAPGESVEVELDFGEAFPGLAVAYKVVEGNWTPIPGARVSGSKVRYTLVDNGPLDTDPADGEIHDPVAVAMSEAALAIPAGTPVGYALLSLALSLLGSGALRRRGRRGAR
ncbi:hypothetical protein E4634_10580 [Mangrovimicrobium sediminis]|uniref:IPTL-CTERM sorting domain-containing protein n=1 Tax=Mangrovimicrobium sediminis TaxID=2562682 RepID=A0A4Z0M212_9GAMM|nr:choice-of-anchor U domain-containing protein [Haliea sp. SAOS-164]TGD73467.1 hypothetical protein E4634_10580 [Haliea sp. SAOS-164]